LFVGIGRPDACALARAVAQSVNASWRDSCQQKSPERPELRIALLTPYRYPGTGAERSAATMRQDLTLALQILRFEGAEVRCARVSSKV
jgi:hypothetical protein